MEEIQTEKPQKSFWLSCFLIFILLLILFLLGVGSVLAKSGLVDVPFLTPILYKEPKESTVPHLNAKEDIFRKLIKAQEQTTQEDFNATLTQEELLGLLIYEIEKYNKSIESLQMVIHENSIETWFKFDIRDIKNKIPSGSILADNVWIKIFFVPTATGQNVQLQIRKIQIGSLSVPSFLTNKALNILKNEAKLSLNYEIKGIKSLTLQEGKINIKTSSDLIEQFKSQFPE